MLQVLLVDDDPGQLRIREIILRNQGVVVHVATNVASALAFLRVAGDKVGMVVTDHHLPGRNGADLVRELRLTLPELPVLVLSGMPGIEEAYDGLNVNIRLKPFPPQEFIRLVQSCLSEQSDQKESSLGANS
jgi:DNA-binding NtrC family response regulator